MVEGEDRSPSLEAFATAIKAKDWTQQSQKKRHFIFIYTDKKTIELGERPNYPNDMPKDLAELGHLWEESTDLSYRPKAGRLVAFVPYSYPWVDIQTWNRYWPIFMSEEQWADAENIIVQDTVDFACGSM